MSENDRIVDPRLMQGIMKQRLTRRSMLKGAGMGIAGFSLASFLAACSSGGGASGGSFNAKEIFSGKPGDKINFANWPLYIDYAKDKSGTRYSPSIKNFQEETGISVNFQEAIQSNEEFFGKIQPQLAAGDDTGWDIIVITGGTRQFSVLVENDWVYPLDHSKTPNFNANAEDWAKDPYYDPNNAHSMGWQSGLDVIGYNDKLVNGPITKMDDLANPDKVGKSSVGMLEADMPDFVMINLGIDPRTSGPAEWKEAAKWLQMQKDSGTIRQYYDQGYINDLTAGNLAASMVWSGDVLYYSLWAGYTNLHNVYPEGGARPEGREEGDRMGPLHVPGERREGADRTGRRQGGRAELQGLCQQAVRDGEEPVRVPDRGIPLQRQVRSGVSDRRGIPGVERHLLAHLAELSGG
jgi:spermidine/putrescine transport system substrate-binding protein